MVPDDIVKPPHVSVTIAGLTPQVRPAGLSDEMWRVWVQLGEVVTASEVVAKTRRARAP